MATFLDIGLFQHFGIILVVLIVFLILYGLLEYVKAFGEGRRGIHGLIAFVVALLFLVSNVAANMVKLMVPWFMVIVIFIFFVMFMVRMFGLGEPDMKKLIGDPNVYPWIIVFSVLVLILALGNAFGQGLLERGGSSSTTTNVTGGNTVIVQPTEPSTATTTSTSTPSFTTNLLNTLRNPKVLGMLFVFLVGMFALLFLTKTPTKL